MEILSESASILLRRRGYPCLFVVMTLVLAACESNPKTQGPATEESTSPAGSTHASGKQMPERISVLLCKTNVQNPPASNNRVIQRSTPFACARDTEVLIAPAPGACLTSGFGPRSGRLHKGIDYQSKPAGEIVAAGSGTIITQQFRQKDFGNWIVIDHGQGLYTSYAHLASVSAGVTKGRQVTRGETLGIMGATGNATTRIHLHVEYRVGDISNSKGYWGLTPIDPYELPERCP